jgi:hypothetical protein
MPASVESGDSHVVRLAGSPADLQAAEHSSTTPEAASHIYSSLTSKFGEGSVKYSGPQKTSGSTLFPVLLDNEVVSSTSMSEVLSDLPVIKAEYVFIDPELLDESRRWLGETKKDLIPEVAEEEEEV